MEKIIKEKEGYGTVQRDFMKMDISVYAKCVYTLLRTYSGEKNACYPSMRVICDDLKISKSTLIRAIKELEDVNMIVVKRSNKKDSNERSVNTYIPLSIMVEINVKEFDFNSEKDGLGGTPQTPRGTPQTLGVVSEEYCKNNNMKNNKEERKNNKKSSFVKPSLSDVVAFLKERGFNDLYAKKIYEHYELGDWKDAGGRQVINWKQKINTNWINDSVKEIYRIKESNLFNTGESTISSGIKMIY